jgi:hypothetical protein
MSRESKSKQQEYSSKYVDGEMQTSAISFKTNKSSIKKGERSIGKDFSDSDHKVRNEANLTVDTM